MSEGSLYDRELAALAIKQARGDLIEAIFLLRAYRTTLPRFGAREPVDTGAHGDPPAHLGDLQGSARRPGARPDLRLHPSPARSARWPRRRARSRRAGARDAGRRDAMPRVTDLLGRRRPDRARRRAEPATPVGDLTREPLAFPAEPRPAAAERWRAATKASCWRSAIRRSAAIGRNASVRRRNPPRRGRGRIRSPKSSASPSRSARITRHRVPDGQPVQGLAPTQPPQLHARLRPRLRPLRAQGDGDGAGRPRAARARTRRGRSRRRRRTRSSCSPTPTTCRRPASSST